MINAVFFRLPSDGSTVDAVISDAHKWANEVYVVGITDPTESMIKLSTYLRVEATSHKEMLDRTWAILVDFVDRGDWVVMLNCDELLWSQDELKRAAKDETIDTIAFRHYLMWDSRHYDAMREKILVRAVRHWHRPIWFPDINMTYDPWSPVVQVGNYVPIGEILSTRWMSEDTRKKWGDESLQKPWRLSEWTKGKLA